jgi:very-short-patch-repair endonuclease
MSINKQEDNPEKQLYFKKAADKMFAGADNLLFKRAADLRKQPTHAEEMLWSYLRTKPLGFKFRRQHPYLNYILDFYCHSLHLVIEVDGSIHEREDVKQNDGIRQQHLEEHGLTILRFTNDEIEQILENVISKLEHHLILKASLHSKKQVEPKSPL